MFNQRPTKYTRHPFVAREPDINILPYLVNNYGDMIIVSANFVYYVRSALTLLQFKRMSVKNALKQYFCKFYVKFVIKNRRVIIMEKLPSLLPKSYRHRHIAGDLAA